MNFELSETQKLIRDTARTFAKNVVAPKARETDRKELFPAETYKQMGELGLLGVNVPTEYGGAGAGVVSYALAVMEISSACCSTSVGMCVTNMCAELICQFGTEAQKQKHVSRLTSGEAVAGAFALSEPHAGSDPGAGRTTAVKKGDRWILNGSKNFITQGTVGEIYVVLASTDKEKKTHGISAFIVEKPSKGFSQKAIHGKLGMHASDTAELVFEDVEVPEENLLGQLNHGFLDTLKVLDRGRISIGALGVGIARGCLEEARAYALDRAQFGKPIADFQAIQWMLADMATETDAARLLVHRAADLCDRGLSFTTEASMGKLFASEAAVRAGMKAIQIHGGYGYTREFPVERYLRDVKLCEIGEGTNEVQRMLISRHLFAGA